MQNLSRFSLMAGVAAVIFAGCSANSSQFNPGAAPATKVAARPLDINGGGCGSATQWGTYWTEVTSPPPTIWVQVTGYYKTFIDNSGKLEYQACGDDTIDQECNPVSYVNCPPPPNNWWWANMVAVSSEQFPAGFLVSVPAANEVLVTQAVSPKKGWNLVSTLTTDGATPVGVAMDSSGTIYASVFTQQSSTQPSVDVYAGGARSPTSVLSDSAASGDSPAGVTVDKAHDVFWAFDSSNGSSETIQIAEFPKGQDEPISFASVSGSGGGALAVTNKGDVVVSSPSESLIYVFAPNGKMLSKFSALGSPSSISLNKNNQRLYVDDGANNAISAYSFPSGKLISSAPLVTKEGTALIPAGFVPKDPQ